MNEEEEFEFRFRLEKERTSVSPAAQLKQESQPQSFADKAMSALRYATPAGIATALLSSKEGRQDLGNIAAGGIRGAGSIGATIAAPYDMAMDAYTGDRERNLSSLIPGSKQPISRNQERRQAMDGALRELGAQPDSMMYQGGKLAGEIAGTAGVGNLLVGGLKAAPVVAKYAPQLAFGGLSSTRLGAAAPGLMKAIQSGGMRAGTTLGAANMLTRAAGGATTGGAMAGLINPEDAKMGAMIGGALPPALWGLGKAGSFIGSKFSTPAVPEQLRQSVESARNAGYVIPPTQAKPSFVNRALEGFSGKITTAQNASAKNQPVTQSLIAKELGLPADTPLSIDALKAIRTKAGQAYEAVGSTGTIKTSQAYDDALNGIMASAKKAAAGFPNAKASPIIAEIDSLRTPQMDAGSAIAKIKELRDAADSAYRAGNKDLGKALKSGSAAIEDAIETHLRSINAPADLLSGFRDARQLIAKTYSVEKAMNATTGNVDAVKLAGQLTKGKPLSGGIRDVAAFGQQFPKAAQSVEKMGSLPQVSPLDFGALGTMSAVTSNPLLMAGVLARPAARSLVLSNSVQNRLATPAGANRLAELMANPAAEQLFYRAAPVTAGSR